MRFPNAARLPAGGRPPARSLAVIAAAVPMNYLVTPFDALLSGVPIGQWKPQMLPVICTAVIERTCVVHPVGSEGVTGDRMLVRAWELFVNPGSNAMA